MKNIGIIDYGMGNLKSVANALRFLGIGCFISGDRHELGLADGLILPGVGAFPDAMAALGSSGLDSFIREQTESKPLLGICLGMQLLFETGYEVSVCRGLGLIPGEVVKLSAYREDRQFKIPHMGWNRLDILKPDCPLLAGQRTDPYVYFVHSFKAVPENRDDIAAVCEYGEEVCAAVARGNVFGTQFHPEKSEKTGLRMLKAFSDLV